MNTLTRIRKSVEKWFVTDSLLFGVWMTHRLVENPSVDSFRVGAGRIEFNPAYIGMLTNSQLSNLLKLEALRIVLKHPYQRRKQNRMVAYQASNITLQECLGLDLPIPNAETVFGTSQWNRQYYEFYYDKLLESASAAGGDSQQNSGGSHSEISGGSHSENSGGFHSENSEGSNSEQEGLSRQFQSEAACFENTESWDQNEYQAALIDDRILLARDNDCWGTLSHNIQQMVLATLIPKVNYRKMLREFRASILSSSRRLTRMKPNRRYGFQTMGSKHDFTTKLLFAVDVSGSISDFDLEQGFSVVNQLFRYGIERVYVVQFDTQITGKPMALKKAKRTINVLGRGGTCFDGVLQYIDEHRDYDGLVVFTDGYARRPRVPKNQRTRVIWLFNNESTYQEMQNNLRHIGKTTFIKAHT